MHIYMKIVALVSVPKLIHNKVFVSNPSFGKNIGKTKFAKGNIGQLLLIIYSVWNKTMP